MHGAPHRAMTNSNDAETSRSNIPISSGMGIGGVRAPSYRGLGPKGYVRSDTRLRELVCEALTDDELVDASNVDVVVQHGEVTLSGQVQDNKMRRAAEECAQRVAGVSSVLNRLLEM
jgi:osmotically-inducible protein OsmY